MARDQKGVRDPSLDLWVAARFSGGLEAVAYNLRQMHTDTGALSLASRAWAGIQPPFTTTPPPPKKPQVPLGSAQLEPPSMAALTRWLTIWCLSYLPPLGSLCSIRADQSPFFFVPYCSGLHGPPLSHPSLSWHPALCLHITMNGKLAHLLHCLAPHSNVSSLRAGTFSVGYSCVPSAQHNTLPY